MNQEKLLLDPRVDEAMACALRAGREVRAKIREAAGSQKLAQAVEQVLCDHIRMTRTGFSSTE